MFVIAFITLIISYEVFFTGLVGLLDTNIIVLLALMTISAGVVWKRESLVKGSQFTLDRLSEFSVFQRVLLILLLGQILVNLVGALGPELGFDALWYHLTLPKLYLLFGSIRHIPGSLLYYSDMPKLGEMLYTVALSIDGDTLAKLLQFSFGLLLLLSIYLLSRQYLSKTISLLVLVIFSANLVFAWESSAAYIDIIRTFYELLALWTFLLWEKSSDKKMLVLSAVFLGSAITTKLLAFPSLPFFLIFICITKYKHQNSYRAAFRSLIIFLLVALLIPLPWFIFSFIHTGNPLYPIFSPIYKTSYNLSILNPLRFLSDSWHILIQADDPINPLYLIFLPLLVFYYKKFSFQLKLITWYSGMGFLSWYLLPQTGGGRFLLAYLPAFSLVVGGILQEMQKSKKLSYMLISIIIFVAVITLGYRGAANARYVPTVLGLETKQHFLTTHLNFSFGDFYDTDNYFKNHIHAHDRVLLFGFHNLYYIDFPFIDYSWVIHGDRFNYIATQHAKLPKRFAKWQLVYSNPITGVRLYTDHKKVWTY